MKAKHSWRCLWGGAFLLCVIAQARAELVLQGPPAFRDRVSTCLELFNVADSETVNIIQTLRRPLGQAKQHTINQAPLPPSELGRTVPTNPQEGGMQPDGPGHGSDSTIYIGPTVPVAPPAEFCAILLHELKHAFDFNNGADKKTQRPLPEPGAGIPDAEIDAMREENRFRKHAGLPQAGDYNGIPLPPDAMF